MRAHRAEAHPTAIDRYVYAQSRSIVVAPAIELDSRVDLVWVGAGPILGEPEPHLVEPAAGVPVLVVQLTIRDLAGLGHVPGRENQVGGPPVVAERVVERQGLYAQRPGGTLIHAVGPVLFALRGGAAPVEALHEVSIAFGNRMHPARADFDALPALGAVLAPEYLVFAEAVPEPIRRRSDLAARRLQAQVMLTHSRSVGINRKSHQATSSPSSPPAGEVPSTPSPPRRGLG